MTEGPRRGRARRSGLPVAAGACALLLAAGCGGLDRYDEAAHRADFEKSVGRPVDDGLWRDWVESVRVLCAGGDESFELTVQVTKDKGADSLDRLRIGVRNLCPERTERLDRVVREGYQDPCATPAPARFEGRARPSFCAAG